MRPSAVTLSLKVATSATFRSGGKQNSEASYFRNRSFASDSAGAWQQCVRACGCAARVCARVRIVWQVLHVAATGA